VLAGSNVGENAMLGAFGLATREVPANTVSAGIPAKPIKEKDQSKRPQNAKPQPTEDASDSGDKPKDKTDDCNC